MVFRGIVFYCFTLISLGWIAVFGQGMLCKLFCFILILGVGPLISDVLFPLIINTKNRKIFCDHYLKLIIRLCSLSLFIMLVVAFLFHYKQYDIVAKTFYVLLATNYCILIFFPVLFFRFKKEYKKKSFNYNEFLVFCFLFLAFIVFYSPLYKYSNPYPSLLLSLTSLEFFYPLFFVFFCCLLTYFVLNLQNKKDIPQAISSNTKKNLYFILLGLVIIFLIHDVGGVVDLGHSTAFFGPALQFFNGSFDQAYSQYGILSFKIFDWFFYILPKTIASMNFVVRILNSLYFLVFFIFMMKFLKKSSSAFIFAMTAIFLRTTFHFEIGSLPSTGAMRFLIPWLLPLVVMFVTDQKKKFYILCLISSIASLWSRETYLFSIIPIIGYLVFCTIMESSYFKLFKNLSLLLLGNIVAHVFLSIYSFFTYGYFYDYTPYLEMLNKFSIYSDNHWVRRLYTHEVTYSLWIIPALVLFFSVGNSLNFLYNNKNRKIVYKDESLIFLVTLIVICVFTYFLGRSSIHTAFPTIFSVFAIIAYYYENIRKSKYTNKSLYVGTLIISIVLAAVFTRGTLRLFGKEHAFLTLGRSCFLSRDCYPLNIVSRVRENLDKPFPLPGREEFNQILKKYFSNTLHVPSLAFDDIGLSSVFFEKTNKWYLWPISSPPNDAHSKTLLKTQENSWIRIKESKYLIVFSDPSSYVYNKRKKGLEKKLMTSTTRIYSKIKKNCSLSIQEKGKYFDVLKVEKCKTPRSSVKI